MKLLLRRCYLVTAAGLGIAIIATPWRPLHSQSWPQSLAAVTCVPAGLLPKANAVVDNGRTDSRDRMVWQFDWADCPRATAYHLQVKGEGTRKPLVEETDLFESKYEKNTRSYIANRTRLNWTWRVRAKIDGTWGPWSATRPFEVEPVNSDSPTE